MVVQGSKRPRQKQPALLKGLGNIIGSLLPYSIDQSRLRSTEIQEVGPERPPRVHERIHFGRGRNI